MKARWLGNSCIEVIDSKYNYLIDPNYLVEPKENPDFVLLTHEHDDHFNKKDFFEVAEESDLFAPETALEKFEVDGAPITGGETVGDAEVINCSCYGSDESVCFFIKELLHTADASDFPVLKNVKVLFSACFDDHYERYVNSAKKIEPGVVIPYHYDPKEELELAKGLKEELNKEGIDSKILELGETLEFSN